MMGPLSVPGRSVTGGSGPVGIAGPRRWRWSREDYYRLGALGFFRGRRVELLLGEIVEMSPIGWPHVVACRKVAERLETIFAGLAWISRGEPLNLTHSEPLPDVAVIPGRFADYTDHPTTAWLVVEVADSSLDLDTTTKAELYATAGVPEYWVLDLGGRRLLVYRDPAPLPAGLGATAYRTQGVLGAGEAVTPLAAPAAAVPVADLLP